MGNVISERKEPDPTLAHRLYWRPRNAAEITGISKSKIMAAIWKGELKAFRRDGMWLISPAAVRDWVEGEKDSQAA